jgi:hypothetical protein
MYPNLVTSQFLLVVAIAALVALYKAPSTRSGLARAGARRLRGGPLPSCG